MTANPRVLFYSALFLGASIAGPLAVCARHRAEVQAGPQTELQAQQAAPVRPGVAKPLRFAHHWQPRGAGVGFPLFHQDILHWAGKESIPWDILDQTDVVHWASKESRPWDILDQTNAVHYASKAQAPADPPATGKSDPPASATNRDYTKLAMVRGLVGLKVQNLTLESSSVVRLSDILPKKQVQAILRRFRADPQARPASRALTQRLRHLGLIGPHEIAVGYMDRRVYTATVNGTAR